MTLILRFHFWAGIGWSTKIIDWDETRWWSAIRHSAIVLGFITIGFQFGHQANASVRRLTTGFVMQPAVPTWNPFQSGVVGISKEL